MPAELYFKQSLETIEKNKKELEKMGKSHPSFDKLYTRNAQLASRLKKRQLEH